MYQSKVCVQEIWCLFGLDIHPEQSENYNPVCKKSSSRLLETFIHVGIVQVGNGIELEAVGLQFEPYLWLPCGVTWDSSQTVVVIKLLQTSVLELAFSFYQHW